MNYLQSLFLEPSVTQSIAALTCVIAVGLFLAEKLKIKNFSLGVTWILFFGILVSHFGVRLEPTVASFAKDFGLILFVYSIGLQVGPSFFSSFGKGGLKLNMFALAIVLLSAITTFIIHLVTGEDLSTMVGVMSGTVIGCSRASLFRHLRKRKCQYCIRLRCSLPSGRVGYYFLDAVYPLDISD